MTKKTFPLERILTMSASDYAKSENNDLSTYKAVGVHNTVCLCQVRDYNAINYFANNVPLDAEIVVDYRENISYFGPSNGASVFVSSSGTALIRR